MAVKIKTSRAYPSRPTVTDDIRSHTLALQLIISSLNIHERRVRDPRPSFVRLEELEDLGLIKINGDQMELVVQGSGGGGGSSNEFSPEIVLRSDQTAEPYANTFIRFREPVSAGGATKGVIGFTAVGDNTMSITSYEDHRIKLRTGAPGDPTSFIDRAFVFGSATASWIGIQAPAVTTTGGCHIRFTTSDFSVTKGRVGYTSTTDDDLDIQNTISGANIDLSTTGTGVIRTLNQLQAALGSAAAPGLSFNGRANLGFYSPNANEMNLTVGGTDRMLWQTSNIRVRMQIRNQNGSVGAPAYSFETDPDTGIYRSDTTRFGFVTQGVERFTVKRHGQVRFVPLTGNPPGGEIGDLYFNSAANEWRTFNGTTWVPFVGSGGSPGGSNTQVQFNNAGSFGGLSGLVNDGGNPRFTAHARLDSVSVPSAPAVGSTRVYGHDYGALSLPSFRPASGLPFAMLNGQIGKRERWMRMYVGASPDTQGIAGVSGLGTQATSNRSPTATTLLGQVMRRTGTSAASANATGSVGLSNYGVQYVVYVSCSGNSAAGGFFAMIRGGWPSVRSDQRLFMGMHTTVNVSGEPSALLDCIGVGADQGDTNLQWMHNNGSGTATKTDTGVAKTSLADALLELRIYVPPGGSRADLELVNLETGAVYTRFNVTSKLPPADTGLGPLVMANTGTTTTTAVVAAFNGYYAVEDYG
jgi:hypothetical protein